MKLSRDFIVACKIYEYNVNNNPIWIDKIIEIFNKKYTKINIFDSIDTLLSYNIIVGEYGSAADGIRKLYHIHPDHTERIKKIYNEYYIGNYD